MKKKTKEVTTKYTWKLWSLVIGEITFIIIFILLFGLSIKALVQDIQINTYKYKSEGTVTVAEFYGKTWVSNGSDSGSSSKFSYMHYVIHFDKEVGGYDQYEYSASNMIATERYLGDRYVVLFNNNVDKPTFTPSLFVNPNSDRGCHSFITDGKIQFLSDCFHELAGQTVDLPEVEELT